MQVTIDATLHPNLDAAIALANCLEAGWTESVAFVDALSAAVAFYDIQSHQFCTL